MIADLVSQSVSDPWSITGCLKEKIEWGNKISSKMDKDSITLVKFLIKLLSNSGLKKFWAHLSCEGLVKVLLGNINTSML